MGDMYIGRKEILSALHVTEWKTIRNWKKNYSLPMRHMPNGKPWILASEVREWLLAYERLRNSQSAE